MRKLTYASGFLMMMILTSCQDVIKLDLENEIQSISVVGSVTDLKGTEVEVRLTAGYFDQGQTPPVKDAVVVLYENATARDTLAQKPGFPGVYHSDFNGKLGNQYHIELRLPGDLGVPVHWFSSPVELSRTIQIDSIEIDYLDRNSVPQVFTPGFYALMYFEEPAGRGDNYRLKRWLNDTLITNELIIFNDKDIDGFRFGGQFPPFNVYGPFSDTGQSIRIEIRSLSAGHFEFLTLLSEQVYQVGGPFDPPPSPIIGNIYNAQKPEEYAFGFFDASAVRQESIIFDP